MKILVTSATELELNRLRQIFKEDATITFLVTGVGIAHTTLQLTKHLVNQSYDLVLQVGIAGTYQDTLALGDVVQVVEDRFGDLGAEDLNGNLLSIDDLGLTDDMSHLYENGALHAPLLFNSLPQAKGITVHQASGCSSTIVKLRKRFHPTIESMEGAPFMMTCQYFNIPKYAQIRSISNRVEPRDRSKWNIPLALESLTKAVTTVLSEY